MVLLPSSQPATDTALASIIIYKTSFKDCLVRQRDHNTQIQDIIERHKEVKICLKYGESTLSEASSCHILRVHRSVNMSLDKGSMCPSK